MNVIKPLTPLFLTAGLFSNPAFAQSSTYNNIDVHVIDDEEIINACPQLEKINTTIIPSDFDDLFYTHSAFYMLGARRGHNTEQLTETIRIKENLAADTAALISIASIGGSMAEVVNVLETIDNTDTPVTTIVNYNAYSNAFIISIHGDLGKRYSYIFGDLMIHEVTLGGMSADNINSIEDLLSLPGYPTFYQMLKADGLSDKDIIALEKSELDEANNFIKQQLLEQSTTNISEQCVDALIRPAVDVYMHPLSALKLGFLDAVIDDATLDMHVRSDDPRVSASHYPSP